MGIYDRDYMRDGEGKRSLPRIVAILSIILSLIAATSYLLKEVRLFKRATSKPAIHSPTRHEKLLEISPINLNTASYEQICLLPHVSEDMATEIISLRPVKSVEKLDDVYGIGPKKLEAIRPHVFIDSATLEARSK